MPTVPTLAVLLDNGTGTFPIDITNKVLSANGYNITRGRDDWQGAVTAGELTLTLNNSDGRFTPGSTILGSPSPITVDQRIRVIVGIGTAVGWDVTGWDVTGWDDAAFFRATGYVKSWPVSWPATVTTFSTVSLTATDAQARAERRTMRSILEEEILLDSPTAYYPLSGADGSTAAGDISGNTAPSLAPVGSGAAVTFGDAIATAGDESSAATFSGGRYLAPLTPVSGPVATLVCVFATSATPATNPAALVATDRIVARITTGGNLQVPNGNGIHTVLSPSAVTDGQPHVLVVTSDGTTDRVYLDGPLLDTMATVTVPASLDFVGGAPRSVTDPLLIGDTNPFTGDIAHVATFSTVLTPTQVAEISGAALTGLPETTDSRLTRLASYAGITTGVIDSSTTIVGAQGTTGGSAQAALQEVADAEMGVVYIDGSGNLTFHSRSRGVVKTAPDLILDSQYVTPDVQPVVDDQNIVNYFEATAVGTGGTTVVQDATSEGAHGRYPVSQTYLVTTDAEALDRGSWIVTKQAEPTLRYGTLTINLYKMTPAMAATVISALDLGCWLRVTSLASQNPGGTVADVVVQGFNEQATGESWAVTCNVTARSLEVAALWDDPNSTWDNAVWAL